MSDAKLLSVEQIQALVEKIPSGFKYANDDFFTPVNAAHIPTYQKLGVISTSETDFAESSPTKPVKSSHNEIYCNAPGCGRYFDTVHAYQSHFNIEHQFICSQCKKSLATSHLLDLHISEQHDSYFAARLARGEPMYACLLQLCKQMMLTPEERKEHCITVHKFPSNYRFDKVRRQAANEASAQSSNATDAMEETVTTVNSTTKKSNKSMNFVFGHQKMKTFDSKNRKSRDGKAKEEGATLEDMKSLEEALDEMS